MQLPPLSAISICRLSTLTHELTPRYSSLNLSYVSSNAGKFVAATRACGARFGLEAYQYLVKGDRVAKTYRHASGLVYTFPFPP